ncbi:MAG: hypothetical protein JWP25_7594 [Bradyrhizobium sp.]|nr:hypothetical protein [Bradyrhizobium sp.]
MSTITLSAPVALAPAFPTAAVTSCLHDELIEAVKAEALIKGTTLPGSPAQIAKASVPIDSLVVVSILCAIEPIVGFELPEHVVRTGGYSSVESALGHLLPRIEAQWTKKKGAKP